MIRNTQKGVFATLSNLNLAVKHINEETLLNVPWIGQDFRQLLTDCTNELNQAKEEHDRIDTELSDARKHYKQTAMRLTQAVTDFYLVLHRLGRRRGETEILAKSYGRPSTLPKKSATEQWLQQARTIVKGDETARAMNLPEPTNPSVAEIAQILAEAETVGKSWMEIQVRMKTNKKALRQKRAQGQRALSGLAKRLKEALHQEPPSVQRAVMRTLGFKFSSQTDDATEPPGGDNGPDKPKVKLSIRAVDPETPNP